MEKAKLQLRMIKFLKGKYASVTGIFFVSVALQFFLPAAEKTTVKELIPEDKHRQEPGWYEQYYLMKKDENGKIPSGLYKSWSEQSKINVLSKKGTEDILTDIKNLGPTNVGGRTRAILVDKSNPNHILAGAISGGLWQSYTRGKSWQLLDDFSANLNISCITQDPFNTKVIYYGTGEGTGNSSNAPGEGIFKSVDGGKTFTQLAATRSATFEYIWDIKHSLVDSNTIYLSAKGYGLYRSQDGGLSFDRIFPTSNSIYDIEVFPDGKIMFSLGASGVFSSKDGSAGSFVKLSNGLPFSGFNRIDIAYCDSFYNVIYAQYANSAGDGIVGLYRSEDSGATWVQRGNASNMSSINFSYSWYCYTLAVKPDNPNAVIGGAVTVGFSEDGGLSWRKAKQSHADNHTIIPDPANPDKYFLGNDGGIYSYSWKDHATTFEDLNSGYISTQFYAGAYFPTGIDIVGGTQDNGTHRTINGLSNFSKLYGADGSFTAINQQEPNIGYISYQNGQILKSTNIRNSAPSFTRVTGEMGNGSGAITDGAWFINPFEINLKKGNELYFVTKRRVYRTTDDAASWTPLINMVSASYSPYAIGISGEDNPTVYIGGLSGMFRRVDNASTAAPGQEVDLRSSVPVSVRTSFISTIKVHSSDPSVVYVGYSNYSSEPRIFKVTQANTATPVWTSINGNLPTRLPVNWLEVSSNNPDSVIFAGTDFGLYYTLNGGRTWIKEPSIPNVVIDQIKLRQSDGMLFIFTHGRGVWQAQTQVPSGPAAITAQKPENTGITVYPNPAQDFIKFSIPGADNSAARKTELYSLDGKLVLKQNAGTLSTGQINLQNIPAGTYLLRISSGDKIYTGKVLKTLN